MINVDKLIEGWDKAGVQYKECTCPDTEFNKGRKFTGSKGLITLNPKNEKEVFFPYSLLHLLDVDTAVTAAIQGVSALQHNTRIVGYFSAIGGWNQGALGQLTDRQRVGKDVAMERNYDRTEETSRVEEREPVPV